MHDELLDLRKKRMALKAKINQHADRIAFAQQRVAELRAAKHVLEGRLIVVDEEIGRVVLGPARTTTEGDRDADQ